MVLLDDMVTVVVSPLSVRTSIFLSRSSIVRSNVLLLPMQLATDFGEENEGFNFMAFYGLWRGI